MTEESRESGSFLNLTRHTLSVNINAYTPQSYAVEKKACIIIDLTVYGMAYTDILMMYKVCTISRSEGFVWWEQTRSISIFPRQGVLCPPFIPLMWFLDALIFAY